jgi:peptide/nickel transport system permease protein
MLNFILKRILKIILLWFIISIIIFILIQLPPGDYLTSMMASLDAQGTTVSNSYIESITKQYHLDKPIIIQYLYWIKGILLEGDLGNSFVWQKPVTELIKERMLLTIIVSLISLLVTWALAVPIGIYSAIRQYSFFDYFFMVFSFIGLSAPGFLIALIIMYQVFKFTGMAITGLFSPEFTNAPWSIAKFIDMLKHLWFPIFLIAFSGIGTMMRNVRALMLDEIKKQYVITARAKGLSENKMLLKYPVRIAFNPIISTIGWLLPTIIAGELLISIILNLPTMGPLMLSALLHQDMFLAASFLLIVSTLTLIGTLISDILLAFMDPRVKLEGS